MAFIHPRFTIDQSPMNFFSEGPVWNPDLEPWFNVNVMVWKGEVDECETFMVPTLRMLKDFLSQENQHFFRITTVDYVTPGSMNETGKWQMETVLEVYELVDALGTSTTRCKVEGNRTYQGLWLEPLSDRTDVTLIYSVVSPAKANSPPDSPTVLDNGTTD